MAKANNEEKVLVDNWAAGQKKLEAAIDAAEKARAETQVHAKSIYELFGHDPFFVTALGRKYRAIHKPARTTSKGKQTEESWIILPVAENEAVRSF